jgi:carbamoyltransferase
MLILGLHRDPWHDTGAAVIRQAGGAPHIVTISEERLDRIKDSRAFPARAVAACLADAGISSPEAVDVVVLDYIRVPDWRRDQHGVPAVQGTLLERIEPERIHVINHHLAHAASSFYCSGFEDAAVLVVDGRGSDNETQSLFVGEGTVLHRIEHTDRIGIGLLYAAVTQAIGFGLLQEGKTMGLAPYGAGMGGNCLDIRRSFHGIRTDYSETCVEGSYDLQRPPHIPHLAARARVAFEVQQECEAALLHLAAHARELTGKRRLCLTGGVALNSVANYVVLKSGLFDDIFINPAASDTGIPLGAALHGYHAILGRPRLADRIPPYLGPLYGEADIASAIAMTGDRCRIERDEVLEKAAALLSDMKIVGHFHGRSETGPRALGNRSILMSPTRAENKDVLNSRVKHREAFRPFAPACLSERVPEFFEIDRPSPYMLLVPPVRPEKRQVIPAVTHVDGTGRLQTVSENDNPRFRHLIELFAQRTGVPVLLNTSFNDNGEPIVETPQDAVRCFLGTDIDALLLEDVLLIKRAY